MMHARHGLPLVRVAAADARERGVRIGESTRPQIEQSLAAYREAFLHHTGLAWTEIARLASDFAAPIESYDADILREIEGIAAGSGVAVADVLALNARTEIMYGLNGGAAHAECTSFFASPAATVDGHALIGQNWDWRPRAIRSIVLLEIGQGDGRPSFITLPEAGLVGKMGFNDRGIGVAMNFLLSDRDRGSRAVPVHVVLRGILNATTIEEAFDAVVRAERAASANYLIAAEDGAGFAVEAGPGGIEDLALLRPEHGVLAHANHFLGPVPFGDAGVGRWPDSLERQERMYEFLHARRPRLSADLIKEILRDRRGEPSAICRYPDPLEPPTEQAATVASVIIDLSSRKAEIAVGTPDVSEYFCFTPEFATARA